MHRQLITFEVNGQIFGVDITSVREIRAWSRVTPLPNVPHYVAGVVNLRGTVLPVFDLAARLGWETTEATPRHAIIVAQIEGQTRGLIVDSVSDIVTIACDALQPAPSLANEELTQFVEGLAANEDQMVMVLNLDALGTAGDRMLAA